MAKRIASALAYSLLKPAVVRDDVGRLDGLGEVDRALVRAALDKIMARLYRAAGVYELEWKG